MISRREPKLSLETIQSRLSGPRKAHQSPSMSGTAAGAWESTGMEAAGSEPDQVGKISINSIDLNRAD